MSDLLTLRTAAGAPYRERTPWEWSTMVRLYPLDEDPNGMAKAKVVPQEDREDQIESMEVRAALAGAEDAHGEGRGVVCLQAAVNEVWGHKILDLTGVLGAGTVAIVNRCGEKELLRAFRGWVRVWRGGL